MTHTPANADEGMVYIVDDDRSVRESLCTLLESIGLRTTAFESAQAFLDEYDPDVTGCAVVDARMPRLSGLALQEQLGAMPGSIPVIILTGFPDVETAVESMKRGAFDYLQKPIRDQRILDTVLRALEADREAKAKYREINSVSVRLRRLSPRERQVLVLVVEGATNKDIAAHLGITKRTVELHRVHVMRKMRAGSLAELVGACTRFPDLLESIRVDDLAE